MEALTKAVLPVQYCGPIGERLPDWIEPLWWETGDELIDLASQAEIGWFDMFDKTQPLIALERATNLKWLNTHFSGVDWMPLDLLQERGVTLTCASGINANAVAEFAVMSMLAEARDYANIIRSHDKNEWLDWPDSMKELSGSKALIMGYGEIGQTIGRLLTAFGVDVVPMRRSGADGALGPNDWQARLGEFDYVVLAMPGTPQTAGMLTADLIAEMKSDAVLVNMARADIIDQPALAKALHDGKLGGAILDLTDPEPIPADHYLWDCPNIRITMHNAGIPTPQMQQRTIDRFITNCENWKSGAQMIAKVDLSLGY